MFRFLLFSSQPSKCASTAHCTPLSRCPGKFEFCHEKIVLGSWRLICFKKTIVRGSLHFNSFKKVGALFVSRKQLYRGVCILFVSRKQLHGKVFTLFVSRKRSLHLIHSRNFVLFEIVDFLTTKIFQECLHW